MNKKPKIKIGFNIILRKKDIIKTFLYVLVSPSACNNEFNDTTKINKIGSPLPIFISGGSDDIGDISWKVPTVTLRFPSNIPGLQGHHWSNSIAMATPIAHKGANAGAKVLAMTILDFLLKPEKLTQAKDYFENVQKEETEYRPMISENDPPATFLNKDIMEQYKSRLKEFYFDETKYETYLEQLGIDYPVIKKD